MTTFEENHKIKEQTESKLGKMFSRAGKLTEYLDLKGSEKYQKFVKKPPTQEEIKRVNFYISKFFFFFIIPQVI